MGLRRVSQAILMRLSKPALAVEIPLSHFGDNFEVEILKFIIL
jgi:hypothetical protein